ncbi:DMT family transporter [Pikeienuella piscinae]|uniref:DMT family transporter n=1 Tax=Pikeienuella piscinae TaxID=2748098 RepID=A0A7L5BUN2_9RHOB|nr:DMT family transporter [Pikeienuella piscinae]QIE54117.1 DMT family transporter [Pikeienuella piscinae]
MAFDSLRADWRAQPAVIRGVALMCASTVFFSVMHVSIRHVSAELPPFEIAFFRNLFGLLVLTPLLLRSGFQEMRTQRIGLHALRSLLNIGAMLMFFTALAITPLAKVTALSFTAPIFTALMSYFILGEVFRVRRWLAIGAGFVGMLIVLRPGVAMVEPGALLALGSATLWAGALIVIKVLSRTESSVAIVAWMGVFLSVFSLGPALWVWRDPTPEAWVWLVFIGIIGTLGQVALSQALKEADPGAVMPFDFLKLIWISLLAAWAFGEIPDAWTFVGAAVIFSAGIYVVRRERREARAATTALRDNAGQGRDF